MNSVELNLSLIRNQAQLRFEIGWTKCMCVKSIFHSKKINRTNGMEAYERIKE